jgi:hypothetical protein
MILEYPDGKDPDSDRLLLGQLEHHYGVLFASEAGSVFSEEPRIPLPSGAERQAAAEALATYLVLEPTADVVSRWILGIDSHLQLRYERDGDDPQDFTTPDFRRDRYAQITEAAKTLVSGEAQLHNRFDALKAVLDEMVEIERKSDTPSYIGLIASRGLIGM